MATILDPNRPANNAASDFEIIRDGDAKTFMQDVIDASRQVPVLVDFLGNLVRSLQAANTYVGKSHACCRRQNTLGKLDIDKNQALVRQLAQSGIPLQSVPTVVAFWQGQIADLFQGALPESEVKKFVEALLKLTGGQLPSADLLAEAKTAMEEGDHQSALEIFGTLAQSEPENGEALAGVVRALMNLGQEEQASAVLAGTPATLTSHPAIVSVRAALELEQQGREARAGMAEFERRLAADPNDHEARIEMALALNAAGDKMAAADTLLRIHKA